MIELIPSHPILPLPNITPFHMNAPIIRYLQVLVESLTQELIFLRTHINTHMMQGTAAEKPVADGTRRFYWVTDGTPHLEFDDGAWQVV